MTQALLLIDLQNDYFPGGPMELVGMEEAASHAGQLLRAFREAHAPVFFVQHISKRPDAAFLLPDTDGARIHETVAPAEGEIVVRKHFPNSFRDTALLDLLVTEEVKELVVCGAASHMCIDATVRAAFDFGFRCTLVEDACATRDLEFLGKSIKAATVQATFMAALSSLYAEVTHLEEFMGAFVVVQK